MAAAVTNDTTTEGSRAEAPSSPLRVEASEWRQVLIGVKDEIKSDNVPIVAAGVAFFALLATVPALVALVSLYGLVADPADIAGQVNEWMAAAPSAVRTMVTDQLESIAAGSGGSLGVGFAVGLVAALWTASSGMKQLIGAHNMVYDCSESRGFLKLRGLSLALTAGAVLFVVAAAVALAALPAVVAEVTGNDTARTLVSVGRWPALAVMFMAGLGVLYRWAPDRRPPQMRWLSPGAGLAMVLWLVASAGFSLYTSSFGSYNETYGSLGAVVVLMLWLYLTAFAVLLGAELDSELETRMLDRDDACDTGQA